MDSEDQDSEHAVGNLYRQEFELLKGMFEANFSSQVIAGVLEDCDGDVNLAVDTLTKIEDNGSAANVALDTPTNKECNVSEVTERHNSNMASNNGNTCLNTPTYAAKILVPAPAPVSKPVVKHPRSKNHMPKVDYWTDEMKNIIKHHNEGARVLVLMRGAPGSGKTYLARVIVESTVGTSNFNNYTNHIFSADDHMEYNGHYHYNVHRLNEVHMKNKARVFKAVKEGRSPVIVDNTNMSTWEMCPYVNDAVNNGYIIEVVEPSNPWAQMPTQLAKRNIHGVKKDKIQTMLQNYEGTYSGKDLVKIFSLCYPKGMEPPVIRRIPAFDQQSSRKPLEKLEFVTETIIHEISKTYQNSLPTSSNQVPVKFQNYIPNVEKTFGNPINQVHQNIDSAFANQVPLSLVEPQSDHTKVEEAPCTSNMNASFKVDESSSRDNQIQQLKNKTEENLNELHKLEVEWDNGIVWETPVSNQKPKDCEAWRVASLSDTPQRSEANERSNKFIEPSMINDDWSKNLLFMQSSNKRETSQIQIQTETIGTLVEVGDNFNDQPKNVIATPKDTNEKNINEAKDQIQNQQVLDNSTNTLTPLFSGFHICDQEDKYFINMKKMFKNVSRPVLREIYNNCAGDGDWACAIVLDGIENNTIQTVDTELSDSEDEVHMDCQCEERNSILPGISSETTLPLSDENKSPSSTLPFMKKAKKEKTLTEQSSQVLQDIKNSIKISENHYSQHYLNLKKSRHDNNAAKSVHQAISSNDEMAGNLNPVGTNDANFLQNEDLSNSCQFLSIPVQLSSTPLPISSSEVYAPDSSQNDLYQDMPSTSYANADNALPTSSGIKNLEFEDADDEYDEDYLDIESDDDKSVIGEKRNVSVNIGMEFVRILDKLYGRNEFEYPPNVKPVLSIPTKILYDLNALWVESISHQLDADHGQTNEMIKQDEEFARQVDLQLHLEANLSEEENARALPLAIPQEPNVRNFRDIMDTELALAIYEKEVKEEWKNKEPQDMAAQMTRKKLYELFPDVAHETLSEMLIAHENSFSATVEILLISTGQGHYLNQSNGVNKFVMEKEKDYKTKILMAEQNAALSEEEYPFLLQPGKEQAKLSMDTVKLMRSKAEQHKNARDKYFQKAKWYYERKKLAEASHYSQIAALHTARYDIASNYAAAALVQYHANIHPQANVIDLHFLRVPEAENCLDLFIDDRLRSLRQALEPKALILHIITGRGKHSPGRPRVKPAIMKRLLERGMNFRQQNPGLLEARLYPGHLLTNELLNL